MLRAACIPLFLLLVSIHAGAEGESVELKLHWEPGQTYTQESDTDTVNFLTALGKTSDQKLRMHQTTRITVEKNAHDQTEARVRVESLLGEMTYEGQTHVYDSKNPASSHPILQRSFGGAAGRTFTLVYDANDQFLDARNPGSAAPAGSEPDLVEIASARQLADLYRRSLEMGLPSIPVQPGDKWISEQLVVFPQAGNVEVKLNSKFDGIVEREGRRQAQIAFEGLMKSQRDKDSTGRAVGAERPVTMADNSKVNGHVFFDLERRTISLAVFSATLQLKIEGKPMPVRQQVTTRLVSMRPTGAP